MYIARADYYEEEDRGSHMERESSAENERGFFPHSQGASIPPKLIEVMFKISRLFEAPFYCRQMRQFVGLSSSSPPPFSFVALLESGFIYGHTRHEE